MVSERISFLISPKVAPLSITMRLMRMIYETGLSRFISRAHSGMLSNGVNIPLISINMIRKKKPANINCCWVRVMVDMNNASPSAPIRKKNELKNNSNGLPSNGMLKASIPLDMPNARSTSPTHRYGIILAAMNCFFFTCVTLIC